MEEDDFDRDIGTINDNDEMDMDIENDFMNDIKKLSNKDNSDVYTTLLKIVDLLDLNESILDKKISTIFLGFPHFTNCGEDH